MRSVCRILIAEDDQTSANALALILRLHGYEVETAYDGLEALDRSLQTIPDVILMDLSLPHLDGFQLVSAIRKQTWGKQVKIVACTGWSRDEDHKRTTEAGFDAHLAKPLDVATLLEVLAQARQSKRATTRMCT